MAPHQECRAMGKNGGGQENSTCPAIEFQLSLSTLPHLLASEEGLRDLPALPSWEIQNPWLLPDPRKKNKVSISLYTMTIHSRGRHWSWWTKRLERKELTGGADGVGTRSSLETAQMSGQAAQDCQPKEAERDPEAPRTDGPARARGGRNGHHNHNISNSSGAFQFSRLIQIHYLIGISQLLWTVDGQGL